MKKISLISFIAFSILFLGCSESDDINLKEIILIKEKSGDFINNYIFDSNTILLKIQYYYYGSNFIPALNSISKLAGEVNIWYDNGTIISAKSYYNNGKIFRDCFFNYPIITLLQ